MNEIITKFKIHYLIIVVVFSAIISLPFFAKPPQSIKSENKILGAEFVAEWSTVEVSAGDSWSDPKGIAINSIGEIFVTDDDNNSIKIYSANGILLEVFADSNLACPYGITFDSLGNIFVSNTCSVTTNNILKYDSDWNLLDEWTYFNSAWAITTDNADNVYVADTNNHQIIKLTNDGTVIDSFGSLGINEGQFNYPTGIALDSQGNIYIADEGSSPRIQKFNANFDFIFQWSIPSTGITGITIDNFDNIYIANTQGDSVLKYSNNGQLITEFGEAGSNPGQFDKPIDIAVDTMGNVYITQSDSAKIVKFTNFGEKLQTSQTNKPLISSTVNHSFSHSNVSSTSNPKPTSTEIPNTTPIFIVSEDISCLEKTNQPKCQSPVVIFNIKERIVSENSVEICWDTNIETKGSVKYKNSNELANVEVNIDEVNFSIENHCLVLENLDLNINYSYRILATSAVGNTYETMGDFLTSMNTLPETGDENNNFLPTNIDITSVEDINQIITDTRSLNTDNSINKSSIFVSNQFWNIDIKGIWISITNNFATSHGFSENLKSGSVFIGTFFLLTIITILYPRWINYIQIRILQRKSPNSWGIIYDSKEKCPIPFAKVRILDKTGKKIQSTITDSKGRYGFKLTIGFYAIEVYKKKYYAFEKTIEINKDFLTLNLNIGLAKEENKLGILDKIQNAMRKNIYEVSLSITAAAILLIILAVIFENTTQNWIVLSIFFVQLIAIIFAGKIVYWGRVVDSSSKKIINGAIVSLFDIEEGIRVDVQMVDEHGNFGFSVRPKEYLISIFAQGYLFPSRANFDQIVKTPTGDSFIRINNNQKKNVTIALDKL